MHNPPIGTHPFPIIFLTNLFKSFLFGAVSIVYSLHVSPMSGLINLNISSFPVKSVYIYSWISLLTRNCLIQLRNPKLSYFFFSRQIHICLARGSLSISSIFSPMDTFVKVLSIISSSKSSTKTSMMSGRL